MTILFNLQIPIRLKFLVGLKKVPLFMKITFILLFLSVGISFAGPSYAQNTSLSLKMNSATVAEILDAIEKQTEFRFYYNSKLVDTERETSIAAEDDNVFTTLDKLFSGTNVSYKVIDKDIILTAKQADTKNAADKTVSGTVTDENGEALVGVNVTLKGTDQGTITNSEGRYSLPNVPDNTTLVFAYLGMQTEEIVVGKNLSVINVKMRSAAINLDEVVTLGYTTQKRRDVIGSVAKITTIEAPAYSNITNALEGKASGLYVSNGEIRVRGVNSINLSTKPLWIIDGVPGDGSYLNPSDIQSVQILKDAAATSLYGSNGANGVIVVTTNSGVGKPSGFTVEVSSGSSCLTGTNWKTLDTKSFIDLMDLALVNQAKYTGGTPTPFNPQTAYNWSDLYGGYGMTRDQALTYSNKGLYDITQQGKYLQFYLNGNKAYDKGNALFSLTYRNGDEPDRAAYIGSGAKKIMGRTQITFSPIKIVTFNFNSINQFQLINQNLAGLSNYGALLRIPYMPIWDPGSITGYWAPRDNPVLAGDSKYRQDRSQAFTSMNYLRADIDMPFLEGLKLSGVGSANFDASRRTSWSSDIASRSVKLGTGEYTSWAQENAYFNYSYMLRGEISYNRTFGDHSINVLGLVEGKKSYGSPLYAFGAALNGTYPELGKPSNMREMSAFHAESGSLAYIGRIAYNFKNKYLIEGNIRRDGLSVLSANNRWATFPSVGLGWVVSDESFWNKSAVNLFKIRGSIGKTGNAAIPAFVYLPQLVIRDPGGASYGDYQFTSIKNIASNVKWETSGNIDIGFDYGILNNRINGSIAYYNKDVSGLLLQVPLPPSAGMSLADGLGGSNTVWNNVGNMRNNGIEFNVDASVIRSRDFSWNLSFNFTTAKNKILSLYPSIDVTGQGIFGSVGGISTGALTRAGGKLATYYTADFAGIDPQKGIPMIWERDNDLFAKTGETVRTGKLIPATGNNSDNNRFYMDGKSYLPSFYGGFTNTFNYKNFDLNLMITYSGGHYYFDQVEWRLQFIRIGENALSADILANSWQKPGDITKYGEIIYNGGFFYDNAGNSSKTQYPGANNNNPNTSQFLKRADNIQLKNVTLGYTLPKNLVSKWGMNNLRIYCDINNALYWARDQHNGNPDVAISANNFDGALRYDSFMARTVSLGLSVKF